ncbi:unnamed protein product [Darwinula stevensoni]|uniref:BOS complex subunit TMEM147 n=1 Tax=Darwinula stevensoni TaxID=69355 RepID=A0A7R8X1D0_9CRUS|nr:unnamed protein product [Darwinula stevensoni]CAG0882659.1 unnamed protein product [Darwinula stevensoni]
MGLMFGPLGQLLDNILLFYYLLLHYRSEYGVFWKCVQAGLMYVVTQLCKMLILATFFPATDVPGDYLQELLKTTVDLADLVGISMMMNQIPGKGDLKVLAAGLGWATAELFLTRLVPMWFGARGVEFNWKYIQMSIESNINLVGHLTTVTLVWLWSRHDLSQTVFPVITMLLLAMSYKPILMDFITRSAHLGAWSVLIVKAVFTLGSGLVALQVYAGVNIS